MWVHGYYLGRPRSSDYAVYVIDPFDEPIISAIASKLSKYANRNRLNEIETIDFVAAFVHSLEYVPDDVSTPYDNYPRYPIETLVHRGGDCEDASILLASLLRDLGYEVGLIQVPGHLQVGVVRDRSFSGTYYNRDGKRYYVLEATGSGWELGEMPPDHQDMTGTVVPLSASPLLVHRWSATVTRNRGVRGTAFVTNLGNTIVDRGEGLLQLRTVSGSLAGVRTWSLDATEPGETCSFEFAFGLNRGGEIDGRVRLFLDGELHDESNSPAVLIDSR
ncbi:hypothetical protein PM032_15155 [Halorubrum ezzemoulense]|uniref:hypothetical protein n=1 Tax=Halorubrum ezzemoulense TaxID=337243 RepID=UPI0023302624|nr:hypothetical protein [Halorubrum ezzemoulense]MDB2272342.1 hypothetical protein [Halorubrum ezzemoulense]